MDNKHNHAFLAFTQAFLTDRFMENEVTDHHSLLGRVFDSYQNMMQIARCLCEVARQKSITSIRLLELSRIETGIQEYVPNAQVTRHPTHTDNLPVLSLPVQLPFADKSFDACFVSDVYEHIPAEFRPGLLKEMLRVTEGLVLVGCPQNDAIVRQADRVVFDFIWGKYHERFQPLEQHVAFGLDSIEHIVQTLRDQGARQVTVLPGNYIYRWIHLILIYFDLQHRNPHANLFESFNRIYNERLSPYDYREPCYRYLILIPTDLALDMTTMNQTLLAPAEPPAFVRETDGVLVQTFREIEGRAADQLRRQAMEIDRLWAANQKMQQERERFRQDYLAALEEIKRLREQNFLERIARKIYRLLQGRG